MTLDGVCAPAPVCASGLFSSAIAAKRGRSFGGIQNMLRHYFLPVLVAAISAGLPLMVSGAAHAATCADESTIKSPQETSPADITFRNPTASRRRVYWIDFDGRRKFYATVDAGQLLKQKTYVGHTWVITDDSETCLYVIAASAAAITVDLGDAAAAIPAPAPVPPPAPQPAASAAPTQPPAVANSPVPNSVSPVTETSPVERYNLEGRYRLNSRSAAGKSLNNQQTGVPELVVTQAQWDSSHWEFEAVPGTAYVWIKNSWKGNYLFDDRGKLRVSRAPASDEGGQWLMEAVDGEPYVRLKSRAEGRYLVTGRGEDLGLESRRPDGRDGHWQFIPTAWPRPVSAAPAPRIAREEPDEPAAVKRRVRQEKRDTSDDDDARDNGFKNAAARNSARANCKETGGYWTGSSCKASKTSKPGKCKKGYAWSEDAGACQYDGGDGTPPKSNANNPNANRGNCGPGFFFKNGQCISQGNGQASTPPRQTKQQKLQTQINQGIEVLNALVKNCPKGQVWTKEEGCHEDD